MKDAEAKYKLGFKDNNNILCKILYIQTWKPNLLS